jgi:hypothetical protein
MKQFQIRLGSEVFERGLPPRRISGIVDSMWRSSQTGQCASRVRDVDAGSIGIGMILIGSGKANLMTPSGGAGTVLGVDYQARVVAWLSARALTGQAASTQMGWQPHSEIRSIWVETSDAVDDIRVSTAHDGSAFLQAKHAVQVSPREGSPLAKTLHQFVRQRLNDIDRLVLITSSSSSSGITRDLRRVLDRIRQLDSSNPEDVCKTQTETHALSVVTEHLRREWGKELTPTKEADKIRRLLSRVHVAVVDVQHSGPAAIEADQLLRGLLIDPELSGQAWAQLIDLAHQTAILQTGMTATSIARHLTQAGLQLVPQLDFRRDIDRLIGFSSQVIERLRQYRSVIGDDGTAVQIGREFAQDLRATIDESLLITGEPGAGKSGALAELIELLTFADVVALSADSLAHLTSGELRSEIGLDHRLSEVLANWRSDRPGYVVIDALDAGRGSRAQQALMELISAVTQLAGRWKVVATVRRFDLRYNPTLKELFPVTGSDVAEHYRLAEFSRVRHFNIGSLAPAELAQLDDKAPHLSERIRDAAPALRELLSNPFSLRLFAELVAHGDPAEQDAPITSRLELLKLYWEQRVFDSPARSYRRSNLLRRMSEEMIARGVLTVDGAEAVDDANPEDVEDLLRVGLLVEEVTGPFGGIRLLAFAHHILFDYAVARLVLAGRDLRAEAAVNPTSLFLVRPSYQMYFEGLWRAQPDRQDFWTLALSIAASPDVPEIAKVIAPAVAATLVVHDQDLAVLLAALDRGTSGAASVLEHVVNALLTDEAGHAIPADHVLVWAVFTESISRRLDLRRAVVVRNMIRELIAGMGMRDETAMTAVSLASRRLLRWTWAERRVDRFFSHFGILGVTSTYVADAADTVDFIRAIITPDHLVQYGHIEMPSLADTVPSLVSIDPGLVRDIYVSAFRYEERSTDATEITRGILNMSSNRRQDYEHSHYTLAQHFPGFLEASPQEAITALCDVYERYASRYGHSSHIEEIAWAGERFSFVDDYLFEGALHHSDDQARMLDAFTAWLLAKLTPNDQRDRFDLAARTLRALVAPAGLWRALLGSLPSPVDLQIVAPLLWSPSSLASRGLTKAIGTLMRTRFADLTAMERLEIENAILRLDDADSRTSRIRERLIGVLPEASLQTQAARVLWRESHEADDVSGDTQLFIEREESNFDRVEELRRHGIDPDVDANDTIITYAQPVRKFNDQHLNEIPSEDITREMWPRIWTLWSRLQDPAVRRDASPTLLAWSFNDLARAIDVLTRSEIRAAINPSEIQLLVAVTAGLMSERTDQPENLDEFDAGSIRSFELPTCVVQTSVALIQQGQSDARLEGLVNAAAVDSSPSVRLSVASQIRRLREVRPDLVTAILATMEAEEQSGNVIGRLASTIATVDWDRPEQLVQRLRQLHVRATLVGARGNAARGVCAEIATALFIRTGNESAGVFLDDLIEQANSAPADLKGIEEEFRNAFASHGPDRDALRERAFPLAVRVVSRASSSFAASRDSSATGGQNRQQADETAKDLAHLIEAISNDVYFSSGANQRQGEDAEGDPAPPIADYYASSRDLLLALPEIPFPSVVHHVLETLDYLSPADPAQVFRDMTDVILRGRAGGYEYDQIAASFVTAAVSRFLVQHRHLLQTEPDLRTCLIRVLDTFVAVGWGEARMLTYQLDTVFR